ncbi:MAG: carboxysome shell carbonic anhydrase [Candidatus Thermoplasmatota archaeon]|nr:carboxysome shell carbonic anhydrase [Candidatus Thermoplasmatota archaeon]
MDTRNRLEGMRGSGHSAPVGMAMPSWPQRHSFCPPGTRADSGGECVGAQCVPRAHPLADQARNTRLADYERRVWARFDAIVPTLKQVAALQHEAGFEAQAQAIARDRLGFELPAAVLSDAWITTLDMRKLYGYSVLHAFRDLARDAAAHMLNGVEEAEAMTRFFIECGFHEVDVSACADGRLKGLLQYILRLPQQAVRRHQAYAGSMFDVEANVKQWTETELRRFREGMPTLPDSGTRYLKIAVYHFSSSDPHHEGCAAHGSDDRRAAQSALDRLRAFGTAIENGFCCGASVATLLIGVDTDNDAIRVHVPDGKGGMSLDCYVDNMALYQATAGRSETDARWRLGAIVDETARQHGRSAPDAGMRRLIERLLANNLSQIDYVCAYHRGRYDDIGHAERFISIGDGFDEVHLRNLAYFGHMHTVEEGAADMDVGIGIFTRLNVARGLPVPIAIHYRYDSRVPGSKERAAARCRRVRAAIEARYPDLAKNDLLFCAMTVQAQKAGSTLEWAEENDMDAHGH